MQADVLHPQRRTKAEHPLAALGDVVIAGQVHFGEQALPCGRSRLGDKAHRGCRRLAKKAGSVTMPHSFRMHPIADQAVLATKSCSRLGQAGGREEELLLWLPLVAKKTCSGTKTSRRSYTSPLQHPSTLHPGVFWARGERARYEARSPYSGSSSPLSEARKEELSREAGKFYLSVMHPISHNISHVVRHIDRAPLVRHIATRVRHIATTPLRGVLGGWRPA